MATREFRPVQFKVRIQWRVLADESLSCYHDGNWKDDCRACVVQRDMIESGLDWHWYFDPLTDDRVAEGRAETVEQRDALTAFIAICRGDRDPRTLTCPT